MVDKISPEDQAKADAAVKKLEEDKKRIAANLDKILTPAQKVVEPHLQQITDKGFVVGGGIAVNGHTGVRPSDDFDFFGKTTFDSHQLASEFDFSALNIDRVRHAENTLEYFFDVKLDGKTTQVKVSIFGKPDMNIQLAVTNIQGHTFSIFRELDVFAAKLTVVYQREAWRDYQDIASLLRFSGYSLQQALDHIKVLFGLPERAHLHILPYIRQALADARNVKGVYPADVTLIERELKKMGWL